MNRAKLRFLKENQFKFSHNKLAKKLNVSKRELLNLLKKAHDLPDLPASKPKKFKQIFFTLAPLIIFLTGLGLRIAYFLKIKNDLLLNLPILDSLYYYDWAVKLSQGQKLIKGAFFVEPAYAYLWAFFIKFLPKIPHPLILLQIFLGSLTPVLIYLTLRKLVNPCLSFILSLLTSLISQTVFFDLLYLKNSLAIFLITLFIFFLDPIWKKQKLWGFLFLGLLAGLISLFVTLIMFGILCLVLGIFYFKKPWFLAVGIIAGFLIAVSPAAIHNWRANRLLSLVNYPFGIQLYWSNWEGADGSSVRPPEFISVDPEEEEASWQKLASAYLGKPAGPNEASHFWLVQAFKEILSHPFHFLGLTLKRTYLLFHSLSLNDDYDQSYSFGLFPVLKYLPPFWLFLILGAWGLLINIGQWKKYFPYFAIFVSYVLVLITTHLSERYRLALLPLAMVFTGLFISWLKEKYENSDYLSLISAGLALGITFIVCLLPLKNITSTGVKDMENSFGYELEKQGHIEEAQTHFEQALKQASNFYPARKNLADLYLKQGKIEEALTRVLCQ